LIELSVGVICANLPIMRPLLKRYIMKPISYVRGSTDKTPRHTPGNSHHYMFSARKIHPKKSQSSTLFSSQASTQVSTQGHSEYYPEPEDVEAQTNRGWRAFLPHKESRFVGDTTMGSVMDNSKTRLANVEEGHEPPIPMGEIRVQRDVEWRGSLHSSSPDDHQMPRIPEPAAPKPLRNE
jgi:hypothetical protein